MPTDPALYALYQENLRLGELLTLVAQDLERLAAKEPAWRVLLRRAMRIRPELPPSGSKACSPQASLTAARG